MLASVYCVCNMSTGRVKTPVNPESEGIHWKSDVFLVLFPFFKHAVNFCEVKNTYGNHFICYDEAKYIDI